MKKSILPIAVLAVALMSCSFFGAKVTDDTVKKFTVAWKNLKAMGMVKGEMPSGVKGIQEFEKAVKAAGFKSVIEFMGVQQKIGQAFVVVKARKVMNDPKASIADWEKMLDDPSIPEETKKVVRDAITAGGKDKNIKHMKTVVDLLARMSDADTLAVVERNEAMLTALFTEK